MVTTTTSLTSNKTFVERFPIYDREEFGKHWWFVLHNIAATMSERPKSGEKNDTKLLIKLLLKKIPCEECREHALDYIKTHPIKKTDLNDPWSMFKYTCDFHNSVNKRLGKPIVNCEKTFDPSLKQEQHCYDCYDEGYYVIPDSFSTMEQFKQISIEYFEELCREDNIPIPEIIWGACPDYPSTSCGEFSKISGNKIYLNPLNASLKTIAHEYHHYRDYVKNNKTSFSESEANSFAESKLSHFTLNKSMFNQNNQEGSTMDNKVIAKYEDDVHPRVVVGSYEPIRPTVTSFSESGYVGTGTPSTYSHPEAATSSFPMFAKYKEMHRQVELEEAKKDTHKIGVLSHLDSFYDKPSEVTQLTAQDLNLFHTTLLIKNIASTLIQSNTTKLGGMLFSGLLGMILFLTTTLMKKNIRYRDKQLLHLLAAGFTWDLITYINPKNSSELREQLMQVIKNVKSGKIGKDNMSQIFETPKSWKKKQKPAVPMFSAVPGQVYQFNPSGQSYFASAGEPKGIDAVKAMVAGSNAMVGTPISGANLNPAEYGSLNAQDAPTQAIYDPYGNLMGNVHGTGDNQVFIPAPISELEQLYNQYYNQYAEGPHIVPKGQKLESSSDYMYKSKVNPYSFKIAG